MSSLDQVVKWAMELVAMEKPDWCVLDTETTGVEKDDEIIEICIIDSRGQTLLNTRIRPFKRVSEGAFRVHGISTESLREGENRARSFMEVWPQIFMVLRQFRRVITYNAEFDNRMLRQSAAKSDILLFMSKRAIQIAESACMDDDVDESAGGGQGGQGYAARKRRHALPLQWECLIEAYAEYHGGPGSRWQKLEVACEHMGVELPESEKHSALGDARATLGLLRKLAELGKAEQALEALVVEQKLEAVSDGRG